uniref:PRONE domain-containing protein n=1 Tax=Opuntia streptacantha TaxID=393608 RepID=A0A7C8ZNC7_OPUST
MHNAEVFSPDELLDMLKINSEHEALELADRVEASLYTWKRKSGMTHSRSWHVMKDFRPEADRNDKNHILAERAATLLFCLKHRFPSNLGSDISERTPSENSSGGWSRSWRRRSSRFESLNLRLAFGLITFVLFQTLLHNFSITQM